MYFFKTPSLIRKLFPGLTWRVNTKEKVIYLTFDDGPIPEVTPWVLEQLRTFEARATFFMVGENIAKHPAVYDQVIGEGHQVGNHTYNHLKGWQTDNNLYLENIAKAEEQIELQRRGLFRPPYGQLTPSQMRTLSKQTKIIMWDVLSGDFDKNLSPARCLKKSIANSRSGSIVVFHDSLKTINLLKKVLPDYLAHFSELGYKFSALPL